MDNKEPSTAEKYYTAHLKRMSEYQKRNKDKIKEKNKNYLNRLKDDPDRHKEYLEKKRQYYLTVTKPKLQAVKQQDNI